MRDGQQGQGTKALVKCFFLLKKNNRVVNRWGGGGGGVALRYWISWTDEAISEKEEQDLLGEKETVF